MWSLRQRTRAGLQQDPGLRRRRQETEGRPEGRRHRTLEAGGRLERAWLYLQRCPCSRTGRPAAPGPPRALAGQQPVQPHQLRGLWAGTALGGSSSSAPPLPAGPGRQPTWPPAATGASGG